MEARNVDVLTLDPSLLPKEQTYLEDADADKLAVAIMAAGQDIRGGPYAVANAIILHGHKFGEPVKDGPFDEPRAHPGNYQNLAPDQLTNLILPKRSILMVNELA
jgi:hypothetical protein